MKKCVVEMLDVVFMRINCVSFESLNVKFSLEYKMAAFARHESNIGYLEFVIFAQKELFKIIFAGHSFKVENCETSVSICADKLLSIIHNREKKSFYN